jgi:hypothetical protein
MYASRHDLKIYQAAKIDICEHSSTEMRDPPTTEPRPGPRQLAEAWNLILATLREDYDTSVSSARARYNSGRRRPIHAVRTQYCGSCIYCMTDWEITIAPTRGVRGFYGLDIQTWQNFGDAGIGRFVKCPHNAGRPADNKTWRALVGGQKVRWLRYPGDVIKRASECNYVDLAYAERIM